MFNFSLIVFKMAAYRPDPPAQGPREDTDAFMTAFLAGNSNQALNAAHEGLGIGLDRVVRTKEWIEEGDEESRKWDSYWWRCGLYDLRP